MTTGGNVLINCVGGTAARLLPDEGTRGYARIVHTPDEIVREIHKQIKMGVDWIKVHVSGHPFAPARRPGKSQPGRWTSSSWFATPHTSSAFQLWGIVATLPAPATQPLPAST
ncbi:MAG: hypothetical protein CM15mP84_05500 [Cellvibrionales bacterium]|nr:MAG: hypothetical protein CM15mP84_05500 [Cellvibrionales bacterium]